jgi:hypothetical protein
MKTVILAALAFAIACVVAGVIIVSRPAPRDTPLPAQAPTLGVEHARPADTSQLAASPEETAPATASAIGPAAPSPATQSPPTAAPTKAAAKAPATAAAASQGGRPGKEPLQDPLAREALAFVGADPFAEEYWFAAINDPSLPAQERQDLIEDLNEDGLSDPKHPGLQDLPLIMNRLVLIEKVAPTAPDQVNADALEEAYKDLQQLARMAAGSGEQVK